MTGEERLNRTESIKQAREECLKSLQRNSSYHHENRKENEYRKSESTEVEQSSFGLKFLMIRIVTAVVLFLCFVAVMELNLSYDSYTSKKFVEQMQSNLLFDKAEECISTMIQKSGIKIELQTEK